VTKPMIPVTAMQALENLERAEGALKVTQSRLRRGLTTKARLEEAEDRVRRCRLRLADVIREEDACRIGSRHSRASSSGR